jgi:hypothetical protein
MRKGARKPSHAKAHAIFHRGQMAFFLDHGVYIHYNDSYVNPGRGSEMRARARIRTINWSRPGVEYGCTKRNTRHAPRREPRRGAGATGRLQTARCVWRRVAVVQSPGGGKVAANVVRKPGGGACGSCSSKKREKPADCFPGSVFSKYAVARRFF